MTQRVICVSPETELAEVATLFVVHRIRRLPVVQDGRIVGIIARRDVLRYLVENTPAIEALFSNMAVFGEHEAEQVA